MKYLIGDIGNTNTKIAILNYKFDIKKIYNIKSVDLKKPNLRSLFFKKIILKDLNKKILFSSVVPTVFKKLKTHLSKKKFKIYEIKDLKVKDIITLKIDKFNQLGSDRISNAIACHDIYKKNCLVIDFGTATTFDIIEKRGIYIGGVISPGINLSIENLNKSTALLPSIKLVSNPKSFGKNTQDALKAGFFWGYQGLINNIIKRINTSGNKKYKVILTGGHANIFKKYLINKPLVDHNITIKGIIKIYKELLL